MPVAVRTFTTPAEAAAALSSDRSARFLAGGTLVMRALNEGDVSIRTIVRLDDRALTQIRASGARVTIGAGVTLAQILRERVLAFLHAPARLIGGPAVRHDGHLAAICLRLRHTGIWPSRCSRSTPQFRFMSGYGARDIALEEFLAGRDRDGGVDRVERRLRAPLQSRGVSLP